MSWFASHLVWRVLWKEDQRPFFDGDEEEVFARSQLYVALQAKSSLSEVLKKPAGSTSWQRSPHCLVLGF